MSGHEITIATVNIAGARRMDDTNPGKFRLMANELAVYNPDIIGLQEVIRVPEAGRDDLQSIRDRTWRGDGSPFSFRIWTASPIPIPESGTAVFLKTIISPDKGFIKEPVFWSRFKKMRKVQPRSRL